MSDNKDRITDYGFVWGPMEVARATEYRGTRVIRIETQKDSIYVYVTPKGHKIRVFRGEGELK